MASGDVVFEVTNAALLSDDVERQSGTNSKLSTVLAVNAAATNNATTTVVTTPSSLISFQSASFALTKTFVVNTPGVETPFDGTKLYKITVTEV